MQYRCDSLPDRDAGGTLAIDYRDVDDFSCGCPGEKICCLGGSGPCVLSTLVCVIVAVLAKFRVQAATRMMLG